MNYLYASIIAIGLLVALVFGMNKWESRIESRGYDKATAIYAEAALKDEQAQRKLESDRIAEKQIIVDKAIENEQQTMRDNERLAGTLRGMRERDAANRFRRPASTDPAVIAERATADAYADTFADCRDEYRKMGFAAQVARNAGLTCEKQYDSLRPSIRDQVNALKGKQP